MNERKSLQCEDCDYRATKTDHLNRHVKSVHQGIRYSCPQCELTFGFKHGVTRHVKKMH